MRERGREVVRKSREGDIVLVTRVNEENMEECSNSALVGT